MKSNNTEGAGGWTTWIEPGSSCWEWKWREFWASRDLVALLVWRDFVAYYKQTVLGPLWHWIQPLMMTVVFTLLFGTVAGLSTNRAPPFLFYMVGTVGWSYFAACLTKTSGVLIGNPGLLGKVYFHRLVLPVAGVLSAGIALVIQFLLLVVCLAIFEMRGVATGVTVSALWTPVWFLLLGGFGLVGGLMVAALTTRYRDLAHAVGFGVQLMLFATPVVYPASALPAGYRWIATLNPLAPVFEGLRHGLLGGPAVEWVSLGYSLGCLGVLGVLALMLFTRVERTFMDTV